jgi:mono/diheme cytochrome c family protein
MRKKVIGGVLVAGMLAVTAAAAHAQGAAPALDPAKVAAGKAQFEETQCSKCHGPEGRGDKDGKMSLVTGAAKLSAADIRKWITSPAEMTAKLPKKPKEAMKKFDLTDAQVDNLVAYVQSLKK